MDEALGGRLELTGARARALLGSRTPSAVGKTESTEAGGGPPSASDVDLLASRIARNTGLEGPEPCAMAETIVDQARTAMEKLEGAGGPAALSNADALALESVMHVRARPALRVYKDGLEDLAHYPCSELWQDLIGDYQDGMMRAAASTGAVAAYAFGSGNPEWVEGSAWLVAGNRVLTNRHVLFPQGINLLKPGAAEISAEFEKDVTVTIDFAKDDGDPGRDLRRKVAKVLYVAPAGDPIDIAVLQIEGAVDLQPLALLAQGATSSRNVIVVGHPGPMAWAPEAVAAVFKDLDSRKRISFGKLLSSPQIPKALVHDASTVGGYSGAPVVGITGGGVSGLHYYGDPQNGNFAITADAIRSHAAFQYFEQTT